MTGPVQIGQVGGPTQPPPLPPLSALLDMLKIEPRPLDMDIAIDLIPAVEVRPVPQPDGTVQQQQRDTQIVRFAVNDPSGVHVLHFNADVAEQIGQALIKRATAARTGLQVVESQSLIRGGKQ